MAKKVKYITRGAVMICENGSKKVLLDIPEGHGVYIGVQPNAMRFDCKPGENVKGFGKCSAADYHKSSKVTGIDKALSFGILDIGQDCVLDLLPEWFICDENQIITPEYEEGKANPVPKKMSVQNMEEFSEVLKARDAFNDVDSRSWISRVGDAIGGNNILSYDEVQTLESQISSAKGNASNPDEEKYLLTMDSVLVCRCGGVIKFETSGQEYSDEDFDVTVTLQDKDIKKTPEQIEQEAEEKKKAEEEKAAEELAKKKEIADKLNGSVLDENGTEISIPPTTVGKRGYNYDGGTVKVSDDFLAYVKEISEVAGIDYYFALAIMMHESSFNNASQKDKFEALIDENGDWTYWGPGFTGDKIMRYGNAMGICQIMPGVYDCYVYNDFTKNQKGRNNDDYEPEYINNHDAIRKAAEKYGVDWNNPFSAYTNFAVEMMICNEYKSEKIKEEKDWTYQIARSISGINIDPHSPRELMFYRDKFAKDFGEEPWFEGEWANLPEK